MSKGKASTKEVEIEEVKIEEVKKEVVETPKAPEKETPKASTKEVEIVPTCNIVLNGKLLLKGNTYKISEKDFTRVKHLVK